MLQFDPRNPIFRLDPYPSYRLLREHAPIYYWPTWAIWFVASHADCAGLLRDPRLGRSDRRIADLPSSLSPLESMMGRWMLLVDPPDHTRLRGLVHKAFTPRMIAQLRERIQGIADELLDRVLLDRVQGQGRMDLIADFAYPLPVTVICALLGIPAADQRYFHRWSDAIARSLDLTDTPEIYIDIKGINLRWGSKLHSC